MTNEQADTLVCGIYRLYWINGGFSVGAIGRDRKGQPWYAPANWVTVPCQDWSRIEKVELIEQSFRDCDS